MLLMQLRRAASGYASADDLPAVFPFNHLSHYQIAVACCQAISPRCNNPPEYLRSLICRTYQRGRSVIRHDEWLAGGVLGVELGTQECLNLLDMLEAVLHERFQKC